MAPGLRSVRFASLAGRQGTSNLLQTGLGEGEKTTVVSLQIGISVISIVIKRRCMESCSKLLSLKD